MSVMLGQLYNALKLAGASEEEARGAASEVAGYGNRLTNIEGELQLIRSELGIHRWILSYLVAAVSGILFKIVS
jgi:hypothetical protein